MTESPGWQRTGAILKVAYWLVAIIKLLLVA